MNFILTFVLFLIGLFIATMYDLYTAFIVAMLFIAVPFLSLAAGLCAKKKLKYSLSLPARKRRGETVETTLSIEGPSVFFLGNPRIASGEEEEIPEMENKKLVLPLSFPLLHAGKRKLPSLTLHWTDPFGMKSFETPLSSSSIVVLPKKRGEKSAILSSLSRFTFQEEKEYYGAQLYKPGDNPRLINWKLTAQKEDVYVRDTYPVSGGQLVIAADIEQDEELGDLLYDGLYSIGLVLLSEKIPFSFAWKSKQQVPVVVPIATPEEWDNELSHFFAHGSMNALDTDIISPSLPLLYLTGNPDPNISRALSPSIWCVRDSKRAVISGQDAFANALGGTL